jgi:hypothetical protein
MKSDLIKVQLELAQHIETLAKKIEAYMSQRDPVRWITITPKSAVDFVAITPAQLRIHKAQLRIHKVAGGLDPANVTRTDVTHECKDCGALWAFNPDHDLGSWSVRSDFGDCCDKGSMSVQMIPIRPKNRALQIK